MAVETQQVGFVILKIEVLCRGLLAVSQPLWDLWSGEGEGPVNGEFLYNMVNVVVKRDEQCVPGAQMKGA